MPRPDFSGPTRRPRRTHCPIAPARKPPARCRARARQNPGRMIGGHSRCTTGRAQRRTPSCRGKLPAGRRSWPNGAAGSAKKSRACSRRTIRAQSRSSDRYGRPMSCSEGCSCRKRVRCAAVVCRPAPGRPARKPAAPIRRSSSNAANWSDFVPRARPSKPATECRSPPRSCRSTVTGARLSTCMKSPSASADDPSARRYRRRPGCGRWNRCHTSKSKRSRPAACWC